MEMEQLRSMGFSSDEAEEALAATGGRSTLKATEWLLSHSINNKSYSSSNRKPYSPQQPKLDRFFQSKSKPPTALTTAQQQLEEEVCDTNKRPRITIHRQQHVPLSERMRPLTVDDVVGQDHLLAPNSILRSAIDCSRLPSLILWGPPGTGKTSLAKAIANSFSSAAYKLVCLSAVTCGVKDVRHAVDNAKRKPTVLFVDEVHRFNKSQQDCFLPIIEDGSIVLIGATTENPSFHLITPLLSRCTLLTLSPLSPHHLHSLLTRAIRDFDRGLPASLGFEVLVSDDALHFLSHHCDGDARVALNALEIAATAAAARLKLLHNSPVVLNVSLDDAKEALQSKHLAYDRAGDEHYNLISALHKSMRGSDADASIYWLARMLEGGEQPLYIARRLIRFASEDVGLADPLALNQAVACYQACHFLGMPESDVVLAQCVSYLALAPKSISVYRAIQAAQKLVRGSGGQNEGVPLHLRNASTRLMKDLGYGKDYIYTPDSTSSTQNYLPSSLQGYKFLHWPHSDGHETI
ncbi:uncharacterized protein LOC126677427 [Mercurialis annua]|uniref:uncharacterized protein LOC126677427 n=1 Tax=Mercurialis annua TaxID=3986 RepID=UPI002160B316|nr:uncharacterized protein LOC126677427 [Mercurialis annua]